MGTTVSFNELQYEGFKKEYENAVQNNIQMFIFEGNEYLTGYAKYLIEYLKLKFKK